MTDVVGPQLWTAADKIRLLEAWAQGAKDGLPERFLAQLGARRDLLLRWRRELDAGTLADDVGFPRDADTSVADLARAFRSIVLQRNPHLRVDPRSLAGPIVFSREGHRRVDYLARTRAALRAVLDAAAERPDDVLSVRGVSSVDALDILRSRWGVDGLPAGDETSGPATREFADASALPSSTAKRLERWELKLAATAVAHSAVRAWLIESPLTAVEPNPTSATQQLTWNDLPRNWPPQNERKALLERTRAIVGTLPELDDVNEMSDKSYRLLAVFRRRVGGLALDYVDAGSGEERNRVRAFVQAEVVRPWQRETMEDFRSETERASPYRGGIETLRTVAAIVSMVCYEALVKWSEFDTEVIVQSLKKASLDPAAKYRSTLEFPHRARQLSISKEKQPKDHWETPRFVSNASSSVLSLFQRAEELGATPKPEVATRYLDSRADLDTLLKQMSLRDRQVVYFADLKANLAVANHRVSGQLAPGDGRRFKMLLQSSARLADLAAYEYFKGRDQAIALQGRSHEAAVNRARTTLDALQRSRTASQGNQKDARRGIEVEQQLALLIAGSTVQLLEDYLGADRRVQDTIPPAEWELMVSQAMHHATLSLTLLGDMDSRGFLEDERFESGFFSDRTFLFRSHEMYYRCACAAATAAESFLGTSVDTYVDLLTDVNRATAALPRPFSDDDMGRLLPSMIWHSFLVGGKMRALQYGDNPTLFKYDAMVRVLTPEESGSLEARTNWDWSRVDVLTSQMVAAGKHAGPLGRLTPDSKVWKLLDSRSNQLFGRWRATFAEKLRPA